MKKKALFTVLTASLMCAAAAITLAACGETKYTVKYEGGAKDGMTVTGTAPTEGKHAAGDTFTLKDNTFVNEGWIFDGWNDGTIIWGGRLRFLYACKERNLYG